MTAFQKLIMFSDKLDGELCTEFQQLISDYMDERERLQNERIATSQANTGTFEVVAIAGTADTLLGDVNVGDTVELNPNMFLKSVERGKFYAYNIKTFATYEVENSFTENGVKYLTIKGKKHLAKYFRKVSTSIVNHLNTVEGC